MVSPFGFGCSSTLCPGSSRSLWKSSGSGCWVSFRNQRRLPSQLLLAVYLGGLAVGVMIGVPLARRVRRPAVVFLALQSGITLYAAVGVRAPAPPRRSPRLSATALGLSWWLRAGERRGFVERRPETGFRAASWRRRCWKARASSCFFISFCRSSSSLQLLFSWASASRFCKNWCRTIRCFWAAGLGGCKR